MPPRCNTCSHPRRAEIDAAIIRGQSERSIAKQFGEASDSSIFRHTKHAQATLLAGITARNTALREQLRAELEQVLERELQTAQGHVHTLVTTVTRNRQPTAAEWNAAVDGLFGGYVRIISYMLRLLRDGVESSGPNSRVDLIQGLSDVPRAGIPTLHRPGNGALHRS